jgi:ATP-dependent RNA helicase RhlE
MRAFRLYSRKFVDLRYMNRLIQSSAIVSNMLRPLCMASSLIDQDSCFSTNNKGFLVNFSSFSFDGTITKAIDRAGYTDATPIQAQAIGPILEGKDVLGLAQTGTGKTAAFALPMLQRLLTGKRCTARALILSPTRELAEQTRKAFEALGKETNLYALSIYGGVSTSAQIRSLKRDMPEILVACPGRLLDLMGQRVVSLKDIEMLVLDEADQMFDMGFLPSIRQIIEALPTGHQTLMFSATLPSEIRSLAREFQKDPVRIEIGNSRPVETVNHIVYPVMQADKYAVLASILQENATGQALIFTKTKHRAQKLATQLLDAGHSAAALHGNLSQGQRDKAMLKFRTGKARIMVATDIAARGIDISGISHVINFDMPDTAEAYTHRIGRTGRMMHSGIALTLATPDDRSMLKIIERLVGSPMERRIVSLADSEVQNALDARDDARDKDKKERNSQNRGGDRAVHSGQRDRSPQAPRNDRVLYSNRDARGKQPRHNDAQPQGNSRDARKSAPYAAHPYRDSYNSALNSAPHSRGHYPKEYASIP